MDSLPDLIEKSPGVWYCEEGIVHWGRKHVRFVQKMAPLAPKLRARILAHQEAERFHEMLIAFCAASRNIMHSHEHAESMYVICGRIKVQFEGGLATRYLGPKQFLRIPAGIRHMPTPETDCVILEAVLK